MKKVTITLLLIMLSFLSYAQTTLNTYKNKMGIWNYSKQFFEYYEPTFSNIAFTFNADYISATDKTRSIYRIEENLGEVDDKEVKYTSWKCLDELNRSCVFMVKINKMYNVFTLNVIYDDKCFIYYVEKD
jgi:hypothetical protein